MSTTQQSNGAATGEYGLGGHSTITRPRKVRVDSRSVLKTIVAVLVLAAIGTAFVVVQNSAAASNARLQAQVTSLRHDVTALRSNQKGNLQTSVTSLQGSVSSLKSTLAQYNVCIPQLQQEIGSLSINSDTTSGWLTSAWLSNPTIVSSNCQKVLNNN